MINEIKDQIGVNEKLLETITKIVDSIARQRKLHEVQDRINQKIIQDIQDIKLELKLNKTGVNKKWKA